MREQEIEPWARPEAEDHPLEQVAHPSGPDRQPPLDPRHRPLVTADDGQPQVGPEGLGHGADHGPGGGAGDGHPDHRSTPHRLGVVVLHHQDVRVPGQHPVQLGAAEVVECAAEGVLTSGGHHHRTGAAAQRALQVVGEHAPGVDPDRLRPE